MQHHKPLYDGTIFHRVIPEFMIQGGDPDGHRAWAIPDTAFEDEFDPESELRCAGPAGDGELRPEHQWKPVLYHRECRTTHLNQHHTIFGQCDEASVNVVKTIARVQRDANDKPVTPVVLKKVTIVPEGQAATAGSRRGSRSPLKPSCQSTGRNRLSDQVLDVRESDR